MGNGSIKTIDLLSGCACVIILFLLLWLDAWRAIKRKACWFPGGFLALSALTLQFISYANYSTSNGISEINGEDVVKCPMLQLVIDSGRLVICVFIAYLLPGFVSSRFRSVWAKIGALAISVQAHVLSDMYSSDKVSVNVVNVILCTSITLLLLVSICTVLAGKTIRIIINQKVHSLVSPCRNCGNIGDHVLRCWILVRCSQPEYIMSRSVLSSLAGLLVTICVILMVVKWSVLDNIKWSLFAKDPIRLCDSIPEGNFPPIFLPLNQITFVIQFAFVLIGWVVVSFRWLTSVTYLDRDRVCSFQVEDFWTRSLIDLKYGPLNGLLFREKRNCAFFREKRNCAFFQKRNPDRTLLEDCLVNLIIAFRLHTLLLSTGLLLQKLVVLISKASHFLSMILFMSVLKTHEKIMLSCGSSKRDSEFSSYREILEWITILPGESAEKLWKANETAFKSTKKHMEQGKDNTKDWIEMITRLQTEAAEGEERYGQEEKYLQYVGQKSWKIRAVSLIHFMLCCYSDTNSGVIENAFKACSEAWPLMDFVESSDTEANLASLAADKEFDTLENIWNNKDKMKPTGTMKEDIGSRISKGKKHAEGDNTEDSMDWMMAAANFSLYKTSGVIDLHSADASPNSSRVIDLHSADAIHNLSRLLANVIVDCLAKELNNALIEKCNKWAVDGEEEKIYQAAFIAGKATSVRVLFQTSQGNNAVPPASVAARESNKVCGGDVPDAKENNSCGIGPQAVEVSHKTIDCAVATTEDAKAPIEAAEATSDVVKAAEGSCRIDDADGGDNDT